MAVGLDNVAGWIASSNGSFWSLGENSHDRVVRMCIAGALRSKSKQHLSPLGKTE